MLDRARENSRALPLAISAMLALACCAGCRRRTAPATPSAPVVEVAPAIQKNVPIEGEWVGTLEGYVNAQIQPHVSGYLIRQDYREGSMVRIGQLLFEIDPRPFQAVLDQSKAQMAEAEARREKAALDVQRDIPEAMAHAIPESQLDDDTQTLLAAKATVQADEAAVEQASLDLGYTKVISLVDGIAGITTVQVGNLVGPSTVLTSVSQVNPIKVYFPISDQEYLRMAQGRGPHKVDWLTQASRIPLQLILSDGSTYAYRGRIIFANRQIDPQTGTITIAGQFRNPKNLLRPGQYARIRALTEILKNVLLVPQQAVNQLQGSYQVVVVGAENRVQTRTVEVGPTVGHLWVITAGLKPGERVVVVGGQKLSDGEVVNPMPYLSAESR